MNTNVFSKVVTLNFFRHLTTNSSMSKNTHDLNPSYTSQYKKTAISRLWALFWVAIMLSTFACDTTEIITETINATLSNRYLMGTQFTMMEMYPHNVIHSGNPSDFNFAPQDLDVTYTFKEKTHTLKELFDRTSATSFLVVKDDIIVYEKYCRGCNQNTKFASNSMAKSFVSALVGIAIGEGLIESVNEPITTYVEELRSSGYNDVPIKHILQMSSGIQFEETYGNQESDFWNMMYSVVEEGGINKHITGLPSGGEYGKKFNYASPDTQALGMLLTNVLRKKTSYKTMSEYLEAKIWKPAGMESNASWNTDLTGMEIAFGFINATTRDYAKFGYLFLNHGYLNGKQIVPAEWVMESVLIDHNNEKHLMPHEGNLWGYAYQWWVPPKPGSNFQEFAGDFLACGLFGQYIYINWEENLVIVKTSSDIYSEMGKDKEVESGGNYESLAAFRAIADYLKQR